MKAKLTAELQCYQCEATAAAVYNVDDTDGLLQRLHGCVSWNSCSSLRNGFTASLRHCVAFLPAALYTST